MFDGCPARKKVARRFGPFTLMVGQQHEFKAHLFFLQWWEITWTCKHCGASWRQWPLDDFQIMRMFGLVRCPSHYGMASYDEDQLGEYRTRSRRK